MKKLFVCIVSCLSVVCAYACTSFIISGQASPSGRPMMFKHRDTGELNNRIASFQGDKYTFIGLVNSPSLDGEVWAGMNEAGFCIMNTASYNLREDKLDCKMDREGEMMYHALGVCATLEDFEEWLTTYPQPWGVEANFGVIDAQGGAAYYEMNNTRYIKYDVNTMPEGYRVVTNFSEAGRRSQYRGWERYNTALAIMQENFSRDKDLSPWDAINLFSRQYRHQLQNIHFTAENAPIKSACKYFIPRRITSAVVCFEGVSQGNNPLHSVMWTVLGYPACAVAIPLVLHPASIPAYMLARDSEAFKGNSLHAEMCDASLKIKNKWAFTAKDSKGIRYVCTQNILCGTDGKLSMLSCSQKTEDQILTDFLPLYQRWVNNKISDEAFFECYHTISQRWMNYFYTAFAPYL